VNGGKESQTTHECGEALRPELDHHAQNISKLTKKFPAYVTFPGFFTFHAKFGKSESRLP